MINLQLIYRVLRYYWSAKTLNSVKSNLLDEFISQTIEDDRHYYIFDEMDLIRNELAKNHNQIAIVDLGAGSKKMQSNTRKVSDILKNSVSPKNKSELLYRIALWSKSRRLLELGTCLGVSAKYLSNAIGHQSLTTVEGDPNTFQLAKTLLKSEKNITVINSDFSSFLKSCDQKYDFIYLDGHHDGEATKNYVNQLYEILNDRGILILDDIYWTIDMNDAWQEIQKDERFFLSLDLFQIGILFKSDQQKTKQHQIMIQRKYKPWSLIF